MMSKKEQLDFLALMATNEKAMARLYHAYAEKTPAHEDFWRELSEDELDHAMWIRELREKVENEEIAVRERDFSKDEIQRSINLLQDQIDRVLNVGLSFLSHKEELEIALEKEEGLIEKEFFKVFETDDGELKELLERLKKETEIHFKKVTVELEAEIKR